MLGESTIISYASNAIITAITPDEYLSASEQKTKKEYMIRGSRLFTKLELASQDLKPADQAALKAQLCILREFFGPENMIDDPSKSFGFFAGTLDAIVCPMTIDSLKKGGETSRKNEELKQKILQTAEVKAATKPIAVQKRLQAFFSAVGVDLHPIPTCRS